MPKPRVLAMNMLKMYAPDSACWYTRWNIFTAHQGHSEQALGPILSVNYPQGECSYRCTEEEEEKEEEEEEEEEEDDEEEEIQIIQHGWSACFQ